MRLTNSEINRLFHRHNKIDLQLGMALALLKYVSSGGELSSQQKNWVKEKSNSWMDGSFNVKKISNQKENILEAAFSLLSKEQQEPLTKEKLDEAMAKAYEGTTIFGSSLDD